MKGQDILRLIRNVNKSKQRVKKGLYPLEYEDQDWRIVLPRSLERYDFLPSGRKLLEMSIYDLDGSIGYYWIPLKSPPAGVITPALRLIQLSSAWEAKA